MIRRKRIQLNSYKCYTDDDLRNDVNAVKGLSYEEASQRFKVPQSTIGKKVRSENSPQPSAGHLRLFIVEEANVIIEHALLFSHCEFPCDLLDLWANWIHVADMLKYNNNNLHEKNQAQLF